MKSILFDEYLRNGMAFWFLLFSFLFEGVSLFWTLLHVNGVIPNPSSFLSLFGTVTFFTGFVYYIWVGWYLNGYTDGPTEYVKLLENIRIVAMQLIIVKKDNKKSQTDKTWDIIQEILSALVFYSYRLYNPNDPKNFKHTHIEIRKNAKVSDLLSVMVSNLLIHIKHLEERKEITSSSVRSMSKYIDSVIDVISVHVIGEHIVNPPWFKNHFRISLATYFVTYVPYQLAVAVGWYSLLVYPIIMDILVGPVIIRYWLRDPFDVFRPWRGMDIESWREEYTKHVNMNNESSNMSLMKYQRSLV